jgi:hypothetical protein
MVVYGVGAGHPGTVPHGHWRVPIPVHHHREVHEVTESNPCCQDPQAIYSQVHQVNHQ